MRELLDFFFVESDERRDDFGADRLDDEFSASVFGLVEFFLREDFFFSDSRTLSIFGSGAFSSRVGLVDKVGKSANASWKAVDKRVIVVGVRPCLGSRIAWYI